MRGSSCQVIPVGSPAILQAADLEALFDETFADVWRTRLVGGAAEPLYQPATAEDSWHRVYYRADYFASALHEVAHWCIAGSARLAEVDYGYWYIPDGRSAQQQERFEAVEARPQALEWIFSRACGAAFQPSIDNLDGAPGDADRFGQAILAAAQAYCREGLPQRAAAFRRALCAFYGTSASLPLQHFQAMDW